MSNPPKQVAQSEESITEKNWRGMMRVGRFAGIAMIMIGLTKFLLMQSLEGKMVLDATTLGSVGLGILAVILTRIAPTPAQLASISEERKAKHANNVSKVKKD
jgi:hypothetical protein